MKQTAWRAVGVVAALSACRYLRWRSDWALDRRLRIALEIAHSMPVAEALRARDAADGR